VTRFIVRIPGSRRGGRWAIVALLTCFAFDLFTVRLAVAAEVLANTGPQEEGAAQKYWSDRERGWFWYQAPLSEQEQKPKATSPVAVTPPTEPARSPELLEFDALQKRVEELRNIAIIHPTESNIRNYLAVQADVIDKASLFADVAQRVIWANPHFDYTVTGRPVNAKALEAFDRQAISAREDAAMALARDHALFFFFRSDCPYCHQFGPYLREFEAKFGLAVVPISVDGGPLLPAYPNPKIDNGIARALDVRVVPALFLVEPRGGKIVPIGYGVLSESELLERLQVVSQPNAEEVVPSTTRFVSSLPVR
jgi:conjugal transfer pilus assembly protein TraF